MICILFTISAFVLFISCQRELSPYGQAASVGTLDKDSNGNCNQIIKSAVFNKGQRLNDSNYIIVNANITSPGSYIITTDTVNGYFFKASGAFTSTGLLQIKLAGSGTPLIADTDFFTIKYKESFCEAFVSVIDTTIKTAIYSFDGTPDICANDTVYGTYIKGISLDTSARIKLNINVITPGTYTITTSTTNGYNFSGSGIFLKAGLQSVFLNANGQPLINEPDMFFITGGNSTCNFTVNVLLPASVNNNDYFPLTANSFWIYTDFANGGDTIRKTVVDSTLINNHWYKTIRQDMQFGNSYNLYYRKTGSDYFEYASPNEYTTFFQYKKPVEADIPILEENISIGSGWQSPEYIDTTSDGNTITLKYEFTCLDNNATVALNGNAFYNVYKIKMLPSIKLSGGNYAYTNEKYEFYYAKGLGLIYLGKILSGFVQQNLQVRSWHIN